MWAPLTSAGKTATFLRSSNNGDKKPLVTTVMLSFGYVAVSTRKTGTNMATSPMAERRITRMCAAVFNIINLGKKGIIFALSILGLAHHHYTFSFACIPSCTCLLS